MSPSKRTSKLSPKDWYDLRKTAMNNYRNDINVNEKYRTILRRHDYTNPHKPTEDQKKHVRFSENRVCMIYQKMCQHKVTRVIPLRSSTRFFKKC